MHAQVWAIRYEISSFTEDLYQKGLNILDDESRIRINRFFHRADACRCLLGRLLPRALLKERGIPLDIAAIGKSEGGKPFILNPEIRYQLGFNVSHDNEFVVMAFQELHDTLDPKPDVTQIGVDIMKIALPRYNKSPMDFVESISDTLAPTERLSLIGPSVPKDDSLCRIFLLWTLKESYAKALGKGLGFDFKRLKYNFMSNEVFLDNEILRGWKFTAFVVELMEGDLYQGMIAQYVGGDDRAMIEHREIREGTWYRDLGVTDFMESLRV